jgi:Flp pilus assembly protein TadB
MIVDPGMMLPFLHSMAGMIVIAAVAVLILCGALVIRKIINIDV